MNLAQALQWAISLGLERIEAQWLLLHALGQPASNRAWLLAHDHDTLPEPTGAHFFELVRRAVAGEPLAYLSGHQEFYGLDLQVNPAVLIPRPDTETLVDWALEHLTGLQDAQVLDLGTGSGAIALALKHTRPDLHVSASDCSPEALAVAQTNATRLALSVDWHCGAWFDAVPGRLFDLIVSNPPYIAQADAHLLALRHEPHHALVAGPDGLDDLRHIIGRGAAHLRPGGWLLLEHGYDQASAVRALFTSAGFTQVCTRRDLAGRERCSAGTYLHVP